MSVTQIQIMARTTTILVTMITLRTTSLHLTTLPESIMYVPSYLLAAVRAAELDHHIRNAFGDRWWTERGAGRALRAIMEPGAKIDLSQFSKLASNIFLKDITG